jgi:hypothetical protein
MFGFSREERETESLSTGQIASRGFAGQLADAADHGHTFGDADRPSGIQEVKSMRAFQAVFVCGEDEVHRQQASALLFIKAEELKKHLLVRMLEIVFGKLYFLLVADFPIAYTASPFEIVNAVYLCDERADTFKAIGDFRTDDDKV